MRLRYPPFPARPTVSVILTLDTAGAKPVVVETQSLGFPYELTQLTISAELAALTDYQLTYLIVNAAFIAGDPLSGANLAAITGDFNANEPRVLPYQASAPLTLRPRIQVPVAGTRIRLVQQTGIFGRVLRTLFVLTPYP